MHKFKGVTDRSMEQRSQLQQFEYVFTIQEREREIFPTGMFCIFKKKKRTHVHYDDAVGLVGRRCRSVHPTHYHQQTASPDMDDVRYFSCVSDDNEMNTFLFCYLAKTVEI